MKILISAGGQGTKVWPFSRKENPKQFQKIVGDKSLFTHNVEMLLEKYLPKDIYVSTKEMYKNLAISQAPDLPKENYIIEPDARKGRGPGEGFAFLNLSLKCPGEPFTMVQADCMYVPPEKYLDTIDVMEKIVRKDKKYITGGLEPSYPVLGVDYLILKDLIFEEKGANIYSVEKFLGRKKEYEETKKMINEHKAVIHVNLSTWYPELMLEAYKKYKPNWYNDLMKIKRLVKEGKNFKEIEAVYEEMEEGSTEDVTQHILEDSYIVTFPFKWVDIGTWDSVYKYLSEDNKVYADGNVVALESSGTLVKGTDPKKLIAVLGLEDMIVVDTKDILFIAPRDRLGSIQEVQKKLQDDGLEHYL